MTPADIEIAARTVWGEARSETYQGKLAVAWVIRNRFDNRHRKENTLAGVATEPFQFSCWLDNDPNKVKLEEVSANDREYLLSMRAVLEVLTSSKKEDFTNDATHYHTKGISPVWASGKSPTVRVGNHLFYSNID